MPTPTLPTLSRPLPARTFPAELDRITINNAVSGVRVVIEADDVPVIDTTLHPTSQKIELTDLADALRSAVAGLGTRPAEVRVKLNGATAGTTLMYPCRLRLSKPAEQVLDRFFLSAAMGRLQRLYQGQGITLAWAHGGKTAEAEPLNVTAYWHEPIFNIVSSTITTVEAARTEHYSIAGFTDRDLHRPDGDDWRLFRVDAICGRRHAQFECTPEGMDLGSPAVITFRNGFGILEPFALMGTTITEAHNTYTAAMIGGLFGNLRVDEEPIYKATTGPIGAGDVAVMRDLATATEATLRGEPIAITAIDLKADNDRHKPTAGELTWRSAHRLPLTEVPDEVRVFDDTFDRTFN